jgi:hypothetical protein
MENWTEARMMFARASAAWVAVMTIAASQAAQDTSVRVLQQGAMEGIADAMVVLRWDRVTKQDGRAVHTPCVRVELQRASATGSFTLPDRPERPVVALVYKPGFSLVPDAVAASRGILVMRKVPAEFLPRSIEFHEAYASIGCGMNLDQRWKLAPLYKAILDEAQDLAKTPRDQLIAEQFIDQWELSTLPKEEASRRAQERSERNAAARKALP